MSNYYLPRCCTCWWENGKYVVGHNERSTHCRHTPSGGTGGYQNGETPCNRIIARSITKMNAIAEAKDSLRM